MAFAIRVFEAIMLFVGIMGLLPELPVPCPDVVTFSGGWNMLELYFWFLLRDIAVTVNWPAGV